MFHPGRQTAVFLKCKSSQARQTNSSGTIGRRWSLQSVWRQIALEFSHSFGWDERHRWYHQSFETPCICIPRLGGPRRQFCRRHASLPCPSWWSCDNSRWEFRQALFVIEERRPSPICTEDSSWESRSGTWDPSKTFCQGDKLHSTEPVSGFKRCQVLSFDILWTIQRSYDCLHVEALASDYVHHSWPLNSPAPARHTSSSIPMTIPAVSPWQCGRNSALKEQEQHTQERNLEGACWTLIPRSSTTHDMMVGSHIIHSTCTASLADKALLWA